MLQPQKAKSSDWTKKITISGMMSSTWMKQIKKQLVCLNTVLGLISSTYIETHAKLIINSRKKNAVEGKNNTSLSCTMLHNLNNVNIFNHSQQCKQ